VLIVAFTGTVGDLVSPWRGRFGGAAFAWVALVWWIAQGIGNLALLGVSGWECVIGEENGP